MNVTRLEGNGAKQLKTALKNLSNNKVGKVGFLGGIEYPEKPNPSVASIAVLQEYGYPAKNIPARPFMRSTIIRHQKDWKALTESGAKAILAGNETLDTVLEAIGGKAAGDVRDNISDPAVPYIPLAPSTIAARLAKRADKKTIGLLTTPLIDTGLLHASVTHKVEDE